jgi:mRNA interferase MazF
MAQPTTKGRVVLVPFPFDDLSSAKVRPAVCLTNPIGAHRHVVLAFITSHVPRTLASSDIVLEAEESDFPMTGLRVTSTLRLHRLMTVAASIIQRELGRLSPRAQTERWIPSYAIYSNYSTNLHPGRSSRGGRSARSKTCPPQRQRGGGGSEVRRT